MSLKEYQKKRKFTKTPEPKGGIESTGKSRFVIQRHQARRLHYDLRLEMEGVLKSWAVPKGPSLNPGDRRLAIQTEDHPVKYLEFEGTIPKGNYGAGEMVIWDTGTYTVSKVKKSGDPLTQLEEGHLHLQFNGSIIKGHFSLVKMKTEDEKPQWLLIKKDDEHAVDKKYDAEDISIAPAVKRSSSPKTKGAEGKAAFVSPMLATLASEIFNDPQWVYEPKWDGYRIIAVVSGGEVKLYSRNQKSYTKKFGELLPDLSSIEHDVVLDGEVIALDKSGKASFNLLQNYEAGKDTRLHYYVFDLLHLNGHATTSLPLTDRKSLLPDILEPLQKVDYCEHNEGMGTAYFKRMTEKGMEGVIAKKADSVYYPGKRTEMWLKIKAENSLEALICGYTESEAASRPFGSLILGIYEGETLKYIGNCGTGFSEDDQKMLAGKMKRLQRKTSPFPESPNLKGRVPYWIRPQLICEVKYSEITPAGSLRHPVFKALRSDKEVEELQLSEATKEVSPPAENEMKKGFVVDGIELSFSNLDKIYWPDEEIRKYDLIEYYLQVSDTILPYLLDRPQNLHRHPDGIKKKGFYQKDNEHLPEWVESEGIWSKSSGREIEYLLCQNQATLLYMANLGCIELNPWNSRVNSLDHPDYTVIDLDPSDGNTFDQVRETALVGKEILEAAGIEGYCKSSGSSGLHIYIPLQAQYSYDEARDFTKLICHYIQHRLPKLTSMERTVKKRKGKIYLDYMQNGRGQTLASAYCVRPKEGAPVSAPLRWEEVEAGIAIRDFNIFNMAERIEEKGDLFKGVLEKGIDMEKSMQALESLD